MSSKQENKPTREGEGTKSKANEYWSCLGIAVVFLAGMMVLGYLLDAFQSFFAANVQPAIDSGLDALLAFLTAIGQVPWIIGLAAVIGIIGGVIAIVQALEKK